MLLILFLMAHENLQLFQLVKYRFSIYVSLLNGTGTNDIHACKLFN